MNIGKYKRDIIESILIFLIVFTIMGLGPYLISGVWPPFTSVMSGSMEPNINTGDMVLIVDNDRYISDSNSYYGISPTENEAVNSFNGYGDVIIFYPDGQKDETPIIHRAAFYVEEGEDWTYKINQGNLISQSCDSIRNCPAQHNGFITIGDNNSQYDQVGSISEPVKEEWIIGKAKYNIPYVGTIRNIVEYITPNIILPPYFNIIN